jgi:hypothetical protein
LRWQKAKADATGGHWKASFVCEFQAHPGDACTFTFNGICPMVSSSNFLSSAQGSCNMSLASFEFFQIQTLSLDSRHALDKALMTLFKASQAHVLSCQLLVVPVLFLID